MHVWHALYSSTLRAFVSFARTPKKLRNQSVSAVRHNTIRERLYASLVSHTAVYVHWRRI
jgi:hypothetical protein